MLGWLREKNNSFSSHTPGEHVGEKAITGAITDHVSMHVQGDISSRDDVATYDLTASCPVLACGPPRCPDAAE